MSFPTGAANEATKVDIADENAVRGALENLNDTNDGTNWVLLGYGSSKNVIELKGSGSGGISELQTKVADDKVFFAIVELTVSGDQYNPVKKVFVTFIGRKVPPGIAKARSAGHRTELVELIKHTYNISISSEYQADTAQEISYDQMAQSLTRMRPVYHTSSEAKSERKAMSRSNASGGKTSRLIIVNEDTSIKALQDLFVGKVDWLILAYVAGSRDKVELVKTGTGGAESLQPEFPEDRIFFGLIRKLVKTMGRDKVAKFILVTMIGSKVKPLQKARSAGQRQDIADFILQYCPFHCQYQPGAAKDLVESELDAVVAKFK